MGGGGGGGKIRGGECLGEEMASRGGDRRRR